MKFRPGFSALILIGLGAGSAQAQTIVKNNSTPIDVNSITSYQTDFNDVFGMTVSWTLSSGSGSANWANLGGGLCGVSTADFRLWGSCNNDTFDSKWNLWSVDLLSFSLSALPGNGVFDVISTDPNGSTPGSSTGKAFDWDPNVSTGSRVTYSNPIGVNPNAPVLDLYGVLAVDFGSYVDSCASGFSLSGGQCRKQTGTTCPSGYTLQTSGSHNGECKQNGHSNYVSATPVYTYQAPTSTWVAGIFGTSNYCDNTKSYNYEHDYSHSQDIDNSKCFAQFYQDMDNVGMSVGHGTDINVTPEPVTMTLLGTGLAGIAAARRKRRRS